MIEGLPVDSSDEHAAVYLRAKHEGVNLMSDDDVLAAADRR
jgi:hypothetical protein